jgi:hypothetical protein
MRNTNSLDARAAFASLPAGLEDLSDAEQQETNGGFLPLVLAAVDLALIAYDAYKLKQIVANK